MGAAWVVAAALAGCAEASGPTPEPVPGDVAAQDGADGALLSPGRGAGGGGLFVVDAVGVEAGLLVRRGSDDGTADRALYDFVTVFHPESGLFFDVTMSDGVVRYPGTTFFSGAVCGAPLGVGVGGCTGCRAGYGIGILHAGAWYVVEGGSTFELATAGSSRESGLSTDCVVHGTTSAKVFPVAAVTGPAPPTSFVPPLSFDWR